MVLTNRNTTGSLDGAVKPMTKLTRLDSKPRKASRVRTPSSVQTAKEIIKPIRILAHSGGIASTGSGTLENTPRSVKTNQTPSALERAARILNDYTKIEDFLTKRSKEFNHHQLNTQVIFPVRHHPYPRASLVRDSKTPECR